MKNKIVFILLIIINGFLISCNENEKLLEKYTQEIQKNPSDFMAYSCRGVVYFHMKEYRKALADFQEFVNLNESAFGYHEVAITQLILGDFEDSLASINKANKLDPDEWSYYSIKGVCNDLLDRKDEAINDYSIFLNHKYIKILKSNFWLLYVRRSMLYFEKNKYKLASVDINNAITIDNKNNDIYFLKFMISKKIRDNKTAYLDLTKALKNGFNDKKTIDKFIENENYKDKDEIIKIVNEHIKGGKIKEFSLNNKEFIVNKLFDLK